MEMDRHEFIESEITRAWENEPNEWKKDYYRHAANYLSKNQYVEGGKICAFCRKQGMEEPHHHNVWGAMIASLRKMGWMDKVGMVEPTTKHTHINEVCQWESKLFK
tara:strand:+ start:191 stop:508 length:318 start_codon:yes stop_codon:yes gene_type:complete